MTITSASLTLLVLLSLPASGIAGYFLRGRFRQRTSELVAMLLGASTIPVLQYGQAFMPNWLLAMIPILISASMLLGCALRSRWQQSDGALNRFEVAGTAVGLALAGFFCFGLGEFYIAQMSRVTVPAVPVLIGAGFMAAGLVGVRRSTQIALNKQ